MSVYIPFSNALLTFLRQRLKPSQERIYLFIWGKAFLTGTAETQVSIAALCQNCRLSQPTVVSALSECRTLGILTVRRPHDSTESSIYFLPALAEFLKLQPEMPPAAVRPEASDWDIAYTRWSAGLSRSEADAIMPPSERKPGRVGQHLLHEHFDREVWPLISTSPAAFKKSGEF